jgi:hypothetical protein
MPTYRYFIQGEEFKPINRGDFTHDYNLEEDSGFYQFVYSLNGAVAFGSDVFSFVNKHSDCQKLSFVIKEKSHLGEFVLFNGYFTNRDCEFSPDENRIEITPREDTAYDCIKKGMDVKFNFLELGNESSVVYDSTPLFEFQVISINANSLVLPFYDSYIKDFNGQNVFQFFVGFVREKITTYCRGGELQAPTGAGWSLFLDECNVKNTATWYRKPLVFQDTTALQQSDFATQTSVPPALPPDPVPVEDWLFMDEILSPLQNFRFWVKRSAVEETPITITNGRNLVDVINYGLNFIDCSEVDLQSQFLTNDINPVTSESPSVTEGIKMFSISDIKTPTASIKATVENVNLKDIFEGYLYGKLNCRLRVDNRAKRLICEHVSQFVGTQTYDITNAQGLNRKFKFDNSDIPTAEEFPSLDSSIDFTGVDIRFRNDCAEGVKAYTTDKFYSEVVFIIENPDEYPQDGAVMITPDSLAPITNVDGDGERSENGYITGDYRPNAPQAMANLHNRFWKFWRPFPIGEINFENTEFSFNKPVKEITSNLSVPLCDLGGSFFKFDPYAYFKGKDFEKGYLQSASYNESTKEIELTIKYYE